MLPGRQYRELDPGTDERVGGRESRRLEDMNPPRDMQRRRVIAGVMLLGFGLAVLLHVLFSQPDLKVQPRLLTLTLLLLAPFVLIPIGFGIHFLWLAAIRRKSEFQPLDEQTSYKARRLGTMIAGAWFVLCGLVAAGLVIWSLRNPKAVASLTDSEFQEILIFCFIGIAGLVVFVYGLRLPRDRPPESNRWKV